MPQPIVLHLYASEYSARTLLVPQLTFLKSAGYDPILACAPEGDSFDAALLPFRPRKINFQRSLSINGVTAARTDVRQLLDELSPSLLHLHSSSAALPVRLLPKSVLRRQPVVFTVHGFPFQWDNKSPRHVIARVLEATLARRTDALLFQSKEDLEGASSRKWKSDLVYLGNGVQDHWFDIEQRRRDDGDLTVLFTGRLIRAKGILELLRAVEAVPKVRLLVAGGRIASERDDIRGEIDQLASRPGLRGRVEFLGHVSPDEMPSVMARADLFALPTFHDEGVPRSMIEAMAAGRPVIGTNVRGCRELIEPSVSGWMVEPRDIDMLCGALESAQRSSLDDLLEMGASARLRASAEFRESAVLARLDQTYRRLGVCPV